MDDLFKKFLNTGVGFIAQGNKAMQIAIDKLVKESKMSEKEGQKIVADLMKSGEAKRADLEKQFMGLTDTLRERVSRVTDSKKKAAPAAAKGKSASAAKPAAKPAAKKPATSTTAKVAGTVKKAAASVSASADTAKRSAAAKAGAAKKKEAAEAKG